jgi:predicted SnoaL-like aldol condensation-catalyzing enzyme
VRLFEDGDYVFAHTEYEFSTSRVGFEVFRFEGDQAIEHWDNIQPRKGPNPARHTMVDGVTTVVDHEKTESNRALVQSLVDEVLIKRELYLLENYVHCQNYTEHNPRIGDGVEALKYELSSKLENGSHVIDYLKAHRFLAEGNFVLSVCEGSSNGLHSSFYDLFRVENEKIIEHWDTTEVIPPREEWKNDNGRF